MLTPHVTRLAGAAATATTRARQRPDQLRMSPAEPAAERPMRQHRDKAGSARAACLALCLILVACLAGTAHANVSASVLGSGGKLNDGGTLTSPNGQYTLTMQGDGNLVETAHQGRVIWATMTFGGTGSYAAMQTDGNFVVYSAAGQAQYSSGTNGHGVPTMTSAAGSYLALQNDANLVVYPPTGQPTWATYQFNNQLMPGDKLAAGDAVYSPNDQYRLVMQPDGNLVECNNTTSTAAWATYTVGQGNYAAMQTDGNLVVYGSSTGALWNSQTGGHSGAFLVVQSDSNIVIYDNGQPLWTSGGSSPTALKVAALKATTAKQKSRRGLPRPTTSAPTGVATVNRSSPSSRTAVREGTPRRTVTTSAARALGSFTPECRRGGRSCTGIPRTTTSGTLASALVEAKRSRPTASRVTTIRFRSIHTPRSPTTSAGRCLTSPDRT
jgi:hypothetical protein